MATIPLSELEAIEHGLEIAAALMSVVPIRNGSR